MGLAFAVDREFACAERKSLPSEMRLLLRTCGFDSRNSVFRGQGGAESSFLLGVRAKKPAHGSYGRFFLVF